MHFYLQIGYSYISIAYHSNAKMISNFILYPSLLAYILLLVTALEKICFVSHVFIIYYLHTPSPFN